MPTTEQEFTFMGSKHKVTITVEGHKSSEGDGRTADDIEREIAEREAQEREKN